MTRTPDEIKKGLSCCGLECADRTARCRDECPYYPECDFGQVVVEDAISCIQQLQADNAQLNRCIENMTDKLNAMNDEVAKLQAERDAAVKDLHDALKLSNEIDVCQFCNRRDCTHDGICDIWEHERWEWRGVQKEE